MSGTKKRKRTTDDDKYKPIKPEYSNDKQKTKSPFDYTDAEEKAVADLYKGGRSKKSRTKSRTKRRKSKGRKNRKKRTKRRKVYKLKRKSTRKKRGARASRL